MSRLMSTGLALTATLAVTLAAACSSPVTTTCDEYAAMSFGEQSEVEDAMLGNHGLDTRNLENALGLSENIDAFCGISGIDGVLDGAKATQNNTSPIESAVDWDSDSW